MSSQWVDDNGDQWKFSSSTKSWQKLVSGHWTPYPLPQGGLQRVTTGSTTTVIDAPPWPNDEDPVLDAPEWLDEQNDPWRYNNATGTWQKLVLDSWQDSAPPTGGLRRITDPQAAAAEVVVVESMGPPGLKGDKGEPGIPGLTYFAVSEVISPQLQNGVNTTFALREDVALDQSIQVFRNGLLEVAGQGYLVISGNVIFTTPPLDTDVLLVVYQKAL